VSSGDQGSGVGFPLVEGVSAVGKVYAYEILVLTVIIRVLKFVAGDLSYDALRSRPEWIHVSGACLAVSFDHELMIAFVGFG